MENEKENTAGGILGISDEVKGKYFLLEDGKMVIVGRDPGICDFLISDDNQVSRKHLEITYIAKLNHYRVIDFSSNGTILHTKFPGFRLRKEQEYYLPPMTELRFGCDNIIYQLQ